MMVKPGYKTSEFWFTAVSFIFSGLYLIGIINDNGQKEDLIRDVSHGVESCILIGGQLILLYKYINGRTSVKKAWWESNKEIKEEVKIDVKPRTNKRASSKSNIKNKRVNNKSKKDSN
jgi:hypothetical protein